MILHLHYNLLFCEALKLAQSTLGPGWLGGQCQGVGAWARRFSVVGPVVRGHCPAI